MKDLQCMKKDHELSGMMRYNRKLVQVHVHTKVHNTAETVRLLTFVQGGQNIVCDEDKLMKSGNSLSLLSMNILCLGSN